ncbi:MAG: helix-turn-helix domain-containing protein [Coriobacteriales bacterium]|jgi:transcriptional regulator with XRE-family HTH domain|nr:helix-turn-helix domain-containing protein [Coriobacteriales bacterium]
MKVGENIKRMMELHGISQRELANRVGVTEAAMSRYVNDDRQPRAITLSRIAAELGTTTDALLGQKSPDEAGLDDAIELVARNAAQMSPEQKKRLLQLIAEGI